MNYKIKNAKDVCFGLTTLAFLLAWSVIFDHRRSLADLLNYSTLDFNKTIYLSTCLIAVWTMIKPSSLIRFLCLVISGLIEVLVKLPIVPNHGVLEAIVFASILVCFFLFKISSG